MRDLGLLKLFFSGTGSRPDSRDDVAALAAEQRAVHEEALAGYDELHEAIRDVAGEWELTTLEMGRRFEQMAIDFWTDVAAQRRSGTRCADQTSPVDRRHLDHVAGVG